MKKTLLILFACGLILVGGLGFWAQKHDYLLLWNSNSIVVTAASPLTTDKVKIEFGVSVNTINRASDKDLFTHREKYTLLFDGEELNQVDNEYGENDFLITYDNKYYLSFRQFKTNWRHQHEYKFHFYTKDNKVFVHVDIVGLDNRKFDREMQSIGTLDN